jgi:tRNA A64-2'-O-ribosylphosphate transferase
VDSTRRGKSACDDILLAGFLLISTGMPDALSKTIPIWCSVLNRALFPDPSECHELFTPPQVVYSSEHAQITTRLEGFLQSLLALDIDRITLRAQITKPLRPIWITPESYISSEDTIFKDYHPIICCTASRRVPGGEVSEGGYIQGSGDDTENWAFGLTPPVFWANTQLLLSTPEAELPELIPKLTASSLPLSINQASKLAPIPPTSSLGITDLKTIAGQPGDKHSLIISLHPETTLPNDIQPTPYHLPIPLGPHKLGSRNLRTALPTITSFVTTHLSQNDTESNNNNPKLKISITIACSTAKDHSIGVALTLICLFYANDGSLRAHKVGNDFNESQGSGELKIDKTYIKRRLSWIMTAMPDVNPSGATLQSVNSFLMPKR